MSLFRRRLMMSAGENKVTVTIPTIEHITNQTLKIGDTVIYNGAGGDIVKVSKGTSIIIQATPETGYDLVISSPVNAKSNFSTLDKITVRKVWTFSRSLSVGGVGGSTNISISGAALPSDEKPIIINWNCQSFASGGVSMGSRNGITTLNSSGFNEAIPSTTALHIRVKLASQTVGTIRVTTTYVFSTSSPVSATLSGTIYQKI